MSASQKFVLLKQFDRGLKSVRRLALRPSSETDLEASRRFRISQAQLPTGYPSSRRVFWPYFEPRAFQNFFANFSSSPPARKHAGILEEGRRGSWTESKESRRREARAVQGGNYEAGRGLRRRAVSSALADSYTKFKTKTHCPKACEDVNQRMASSRTCSPARTASIWVELKSKYLDMMDATVTGIINDLFERRATVQRVSEGPERNRRQIRGQVLQRQRIRES